MSETRCYMIVIGEIFDREKFLSGYATVVPPLVEKFGGRYIIKGAGGEFLENGICDHPSALVSEWPSREAAKRFWESPEYAEAIKLREGIGRFQVMLIDSAAVTDSSD
jgi:uncharacterized protein (DUF1330 family)